MGSGDFNLPSRSIAILCPGVFLDPGWLRLAEAFDLCENRRCL